MRMLLGCAEFSGRAEAAVWLPGPGRMETVRTAEMGESTNQSEEALPLIPGP